MLADAFDAMCMRMEPINMSQAQVSQPDRANRGLKEARGWCMRANSKSLSDSFEVNPEESAAVEVILGQLTMLASDVEQPSQFS